MCTDVSDKPVPPASDILHDVTSEKNVENSQRQYELQEVRYREGDLDGLQLSQYQQQLSSSKISLAQQKINYKNTLLSLKIATLYDFVKDEPVLPVRELSTLN